jgi:hypothetical protein
LPNDAGSRTFCAAKSNSSNVCGVRIVMRQRA